MSRAPRPMVKDRTPRRSTAAHDRSVGARRSATPKPAPRRRRGTTPPHGVRGRTKRTRSERSEAVRQRRISAPAPHVRAVDQKSGSPRRRLIAVLFVLVLLLVLVVGRLVV